MTGRSLADADDRGVAAHWRMTGAEAAKKGGAKAPPAVVGCTGQVRADVLRGQDPEGRELCVGRRDSWIPSGIGVTVSGAMTSPSP